MSRPKTVRSPARGFTLIEMLIALAIVALLLSIAAPRYFSSLDRSKETVLKQNLKVMRDLIDKFYLDRGRYPEAIEELVEKKYLRALPVDPMTGSEKTWITVPSTNPDFPGISDIRSGAEGSSSEGEAFREW
ncbi:MAG: type II secretion system GspH family protein [Candidatus Accumulibacter sp.]|jgi:general secretion pathway protein G|nr:type II secretion system GspH family protein [Accumulibacter sp.]